MDGALRAIRYAREHRRPFLGTCGGFQHALIEFARHVLGLHDADHAESNPNASTLLMAPLSCALIEKTGTIHFKPGSRIEQIYGDDHAIEQYHCSYGLNEQYRSQIEASAMRITGWDVDGSVRVIELSDHPFFIGTLFQPERSALAARANPLVNEFVRALALTFPLPEREEPE
jgi:CTP synthase (UTP-ammonia lyase)